MDFGIIDYCLQPSPYFDVAPAREPDDFARVRDGLPDGWLRTTDEVWAYQHPASRPCPEQGWKVHVSATPQESEKVLEIVWTYCVQHELPFKFLRSRRLVTARNSKYADRTASGKFIALYPPSPEHLPTILADLELLLAGFEGPAVLSDLRYASAPVYVRFGAFVELTGPGPDGTPVPSVRHPDGSLVPDVRRPSFHVPDWVDLPACLAESLERRRTAVSPLPFQVTRALHFSNGGGVYDAVHRATGQRVLLKEARPHAGLDEDGVDAVARLERERWALEELAGAPYIPRLVDHVRGHLHYYLARDFVDGESLLSAVQRHHPFLPGDQDTDPASYAAWALEVGDRVAAALGDMHDRGVVFGDVHPNNVLLDEESRPTFIDLETASRVADDLPQRIGAPGFRAPEHLRGVAADRHGLACLRLSLLLPSTIALSWGPGKAAELLAEIHARFDGDEPGSVVPWSFDDSVLRDLGLPPCAARPMPSPARQTAAVLAAATPERTDRLHPGAAHLFRTPGGSLSLAYGAAGVLWALQRRGVEAPPEHLDWLVSRLPSFAGGPGLFEGWGGLALALDDLGRPEEAQHALTRALTDPARDDSLVRGRAGAALAALGCRATGEPAGPSARAALDLGEQLAGSQAWTRMRTRRGTPAFGLLDGPSGIALLLVRLHERFDRPDLLDAARQAVRADLDLLFPGGDWATPSAGSVRPGPWRRATMHRGSAGTAMVLADLLTHLPAPEEALGHALDRLGTAHDLWHHEQPGLFTGRAGMVAAVRHLGARWPDHERRLAEQTRLLDLHAVDDAGVVGYLGDHGLKLSCDLATGSVGIVEVTEGGTLPFCFPSRPRSS